MKKIVVFIMLLVFCSMSYAVELNLKKFGYEFYVVPSYENQTYPISYVFTLNDTVFTETVTSPKFHYIWHPNPKKETCFSCTFEITDANGNKGYDEINIILYDEKETKVNFAYFDVDSFTLHLFNIYIDGKTYNFSLKTKDNEQWEVFNKIESSYSPTNSNYCHFLQNQMYVKNCKMCIGGKSYTINAVFKRLSEEIFELEKVESF